MANNERQNLERFIASPTYTQLVLKRLEIGAGLMLSPQQLELMCRGDIEFNSQLVEYGSRLAIQVRSYVYERTVKTHKEVFEYKHPATWWDGFKEKYFHRKLLEKFPVEYTTIRKEYDFDVKEFYPEIVDNRPTHYITVCAMIPKGEIT